MKSGEEEFQSSTDSSQRMTKDMNSNRKSVELFQMSPITIFFFGITPPAVGTILCISAAFLFYKDEISDYNWQCGRAKYPSVSRIINLPIGRIIWQLSILFHIPVRLIEIFTGFERYKRLRNVYYKHAKRYEFYRYAYFYSGLAELIFLIGLSIIGERESAQIHVILFYIYGEFSLIFFISNIKCHRQSLYYLNPYGRISYYTKVVICILYLVIAPVLFISFMLYWRACITFAYDLFAICEYLEVILNILYHSCVFFDIRYKVVFSVRLIVETDSKTSLNDLPNGTIHGRE